jgi:hypothetical protein
MALSQKHRAVLFDFLSPRVGEEAAEALMAEFPAREGDELVTKTYLRAELAELKSDLTIRVVSVVAVATGVIVAFGR